MGEEKEHLTPRGQSVFGRDDHDGFPGLWPPHEHLSVVGIGLDHGIGGDGFIFAQDVGLLLGHGLTQHSPLAQGLVRVYLDVELHPPADGLQHQGLGRGLIDGHQPGGEALVAADAAELRQVAVAHRHSPRNTGVEVVVHADREARRLGRGAREGDCLGGVAVPGVADPVRVADGLDPALAELW